MNVTVIGWALVHSLWQGAAVVAGVAALFTLTRRSRSNVRYLLGVAGLLALVLLPIGTVLHDPGARTDAATGTIPVTTAPVAEAPAGKPAGFQPIAPGRVGPAGETAPESARTLVGAALHDSIESSMPWLVGLWIVGVGLLSLRLIGGLLRTWRLVGDGTPDLGERVTTAVTRLAQTMGVRRAIRVLRVAEGHVPLVIGWLRPAILVPGSVLTGLTPQQLEMILAHEIAHVRRFDYLVNVVQTVIETFLFYHPAVWWLSSRIREEREHCCDDLAVEICRAEPKAYAGALLAIEEWRGVSLGLAAAATGGSLLRRVRRLVVAEPPSLDLGPHWTAGVFGMTTVAVALISLSARPGSPADVGSLAAGPLREAAAVPPQAADTSRARPDTVIRYAGTAALAERWRWAEGQARALKADTVWIGYLVSGDPSGRRWIYLDRHTPVRIGDSWMSGHMEFQSVGVSDDIRFSGVGLASLVGDHPASDIAILFGMTNGGRSRVARLHAGNHAFPVFFNRWPLVWLGPASDAESVRLVRELMRSAGAGVAGDLVAIVAVHQDRDAALPPLIGWAEDRGTDQRIRTEATEGLGRYPDPRALAALSRIARSSASPETRLAAIEALGRLQLEAAADTLIALVTTLDDRELRRAAVESMGERSEPRVFDALVALVSSPSGREMPSDVIETIGQTKDPRRSGVLLGLARDDPEADIRRWAVEALGQALESGEAVDVLGAIARNDPDASVREQAIETLAEVHDPRAIELLKDFTVSHPDVRMQRAAVSALAGSADHETALEALSRVATGHPRLDVQLEAIDALPQFEDGRALATLVAIVDRGASPDVQRAAAEALGQAHPHDQAMAALRKIAFEHAHQDVQRAATEALGDFDDPRAVQVLVEIADRHPRLEVQEAAAEALGNAHPYAAAIEALRRIAWEHPRWEVQVRAVEALGDSQAPQIAQILSQIAENHPNVEVRKTAIEALADHGR